MFLYIYPSANRFHSGQRTSFPDNSFMAKKCFWALSVIGLWQQQEQHKEEGQLAGCGKKGGDSGQQ